ncbi:MAG TPA: hypothetical protein VH092_00955 [Urbifossiella sp.]|jgi:hypothetical protein|nr:hypothetical protein [Urbifossiella sp.]
MTSENEPVSPEEFVIRLIWTAYYNPGLPLPVQSSGFAPRDDETDGISVFRAACVAYPEDVLVVFAGEKRDRYAIALLPVAEILKLGLTVRPAPIPAIPGHAVLPELSITATKADKPFWRGVQKQLAVIANARIVRPPKN